MLRKAKRPTTEIDVVIGPTVTFDGHLKCDGIIRVDGVCEGGLLETTSSVIVGKEARVAADIVAQAVSVSGAVSGNITAKRVELLHTGRIWGKVNVVSFLLDEGGVFRGELIMEQPGEPEERPRPSEEERPEEDRPADSTD